MKSISKIGLIIITLLSVVTATAQIKNAKTETIKIFGNCGMCKSTIETAANVKNITNLEWNKETKIATVTYDSKKTNEEEILKRIALVGYDNEKFLAPNDVYANLPDCCQYDRVLKPVSKNKEVRIVKNEHKNNDHNNHDMQHKNTDSVKNEVALSAVFSHYFKVKDALVTTDTNKVSNEASKLLHVVKNLEMSKLSHKEHTVWMSVFKELSINSEKIALSKNISQQRESFTFVSNNIYDLAKVSKNNTPVYYQFCPMYNKGQGANWLSKEETIKNPYYGAQMLNCGSVQEILK